MAILRVLAVSALWASFVLAADPPQSGQLYDFTLTNTEKEFVSLVVAMPADKFNFAPTAGKFDGVRTFGQEAKHAAFVVNAISAALLGEKNPSTTGPHENGPDNLTSKDQILKYVMDAFRYAHQAVATLTNSNMMKQTVDPFDPKSKRYRLDSVTFLFSHTYDHYGQMVEYARMNGIVPPASQ
jgi:uncharacterized damage-inducible protein DinB